MSKIEKRKEKKTEPGSSINKGTDNTIDKDELSKLKEELFADIIPVESIKTTRKGKVPKYSNLAAAIKLVGKMSRNAYRLNLEKVFQLENYSNLNLTEKKALVRKVYPILDRYLKEFARTHGYDLCKKEVKKTKEGKEIFIKGVKMLHFQSMLNLKKKLLA
ncbi:MAG: hypothetical protein ABSF44_16100 [Candidatus Bathyarchaeia archaeon]|jgi:hypothetical protein